MERERRYEPLTDDCQHCETVFELNKDNSKFYEFTLKPECNYYLSLCRKCEEISWVFLDQSGNTLEIARYFNLPIEPSDWPTDNEYQNWLEAMGIKLVQPKELIPRQNRMASFFGYILLNDNITPEDFDGSGPLYI